MRVAGAIIAYGFIAAALVVVSALVYNWVWDATGLDALTGVETTFANWVGILVVLGGIVGLAKSGGSVE